MHAGQSEPRIKLRLAVMADATTGKLFWGMSTGQFEAEMEKSTCVNVDVSVKFGTSGNGTFPSCDHKGGEEE